MMNMENFDWFDEARSDIQILWGYRGTGTRIILDLFDLAPSDFVGVETLEDAEGRQEEMEGLNEFLLKLGCVSSALCTMEEMADTGMPSELCRVHINHHQDHEASTELVSSGALILVGFLVEQGILEVARRDEDNGS